MKAVIRPILRSVSFRRGPTGLTGPAGTTNYDELNNVPLEFPPSAHTHTFADLVEMPTTLDGYGITDAATAQALSDEVDRAQYVENSLYGEINNLYNYAAYAGRTITAGTGLTGGGNLLADFSVSLTGQALALHNLATTGLIVRTGAGTVAARTFTLTGLGSLTNGNGVSGNPTLTLTEASDAEMQAGTATTFATARRVLALWTWLKTQAQTISAQWIFSTAPRSTGTIASLLDVPNIGQVDKRGMPFLRPTDTFQIRRRMEYFLRGSQTNGDIGEWGWSLNTPSGGSSAYAISGGGFVTGLDFRMATGATSGNRITLYKILGGTQVDWKAATTFYLNTSLVATSDSPIANGAVWVGWRDDNLAGAGRFLVGWDTTVGPNFLIKLAGSAGEAEVVTDTGVPVPTGHTFWGPEFKITLVGLSFNQSVLGGTANKHRVIIVGNTTSNTVSTLFDGEVTANGSVYNNRLIAEVKTNTATSKLLIVTGVEIQHSGCGNQSQH